MMNLKAALAALAFLLAPTLAHAQAGDADATCQAIIANRNSINAPVVHLYGDSIFRGYNLGQFPDGANPLPTDHPLYAFRSIASIANWALSHNGRAERFAYCGNISSSAISARIAAGIIRSGDFVVLEDAGDYPAGPASYYANVAWPARQAASAPGVTVVMMSMFDYCISGNMGCNPAMQWDAAVGTQGTLNDAIRRAALVTSNGVGGSALAGQTRFIDMDWRMNAWRNSALAVDGVEVVHLDGVHTNVWGGVEMVSSLLTIAALRQHITDTTPLEDLAAENFAFLGYGTSSPTWTAPRARTYMRSKLRAN